MKHLKIFLLLTIALVTSVLFATAAYKADNAKAKTEASAKLRAFPVGATVTPADYHWDSSISNDCFPWDTWTPDPYFNALYWVNTPCKVTGPEMTICGTPATPIELTLYTGSGVVKYYRYWPTAYLN